MKPVMPKRCVDCGDFRADGAREWAADVDMDAKCRLASTRWWCGNLMMPMSAMFVARPGSEPPKVCPRRG